MKRKSIPTFIGLFLLIFGLAAALVLVRGNQIFRLGAAGDFEPQNVQTTNVSDNTFTVSWVTGKGALTFVKWGTSSGNLDKKADGEIKDLSFVHSISVSGAVSNTTYFFKINSGGKEFDNNGSPWQVKTGTALAPNEKVNNISGTVLTATGNPAKGALVYLTAGGGATLSTTASQKGSWIIPVSSIRTQDLSSYVSINDASTILEITVNAGPDGVATAQVYPQSGKPVPPIILGATNDFKNAPISNTSDLPKASLQVPPETQAQSGFNVEVTPTPPGKGAGTVTLDSVEQGEVITSTSPEFFGGGPAGETLTITVESEAQTAEVKVPTTGTWKWTPPADLPEGTHKVKISWRDSSGILRTIERTFVVQAAEGPAFVSTPSGTTTATPTATPKSTITASPTATAKATATPAAAGSTTASPTPTATLNPEVTDSGVLTPTIALSIMGIGLLAFSLFIFKESSA